MTKSNNAAFPLSTDTLGEAVGLTKLEYFAIQFAAARRGHQHGHQWTSTASAEGAVTDAKALIAELNKKDAS